jgi:hypothetical protein
MTYDIDAIRRKLKDSMSNRRSDPDEFKPKKAESASEPIRYRFFVMPPIFVGDQTKQGTAKKAMDQFYVQNGSHWVNDRPNPCPRIYDGSKCEVCDFGFSLMKGVKDPDRKTAIRQQWLSSSSYMVNIFFPSVKTNPEEVRGRVMYFNAPKTCCDIWTNTIMKDSGSDDEDPQAYGAFFDENAGFLFELQVLKNGRQNGYKTSKFITTDGKPVPFIKLEDGSPDKKALEKLLAQRHDLWLKVQVPDPVKIKALAASMIDGDDGDDDSPKASSSRITTTNEDDEDDNPQPASKPIKEAKSAKAPKPAEDPAPAPKQDVKPPVEDDDDDSDIDDLIKGLPDDEDD